MTEEERQLEDVVLATSVAMHAQVRANADAEFYTPLIAINRCDVCSSQAYIRVTVLVPDKGKDCELLFCCHHFGIHQPALLYMGAKVRQDQRDELVREETRV
jgi:hypothetical protein